MVELIKIKREPLTLINVNLLTVRLSRYVYDEETQLTSTECTGHQKVAATKGMETAANAK